MRKVAICIPHYGDWKPAFALDLVGLISCLPETRDLSVEIFRVSSSILLQGRQNLAKSAVESESDYALFLDVDMRFPPDTLLRLLSRNKDLIGANYTQRFPPHRPVAYSLDKDHRISSRGKTGIQETGLIGFGVCLISTKVFKAMPKPWFMFGYNPKVDDFVGEDVFFFKRAKEAGFQAWVDHDLSQDVRHIGEVELDTDMSAIG